MVTPFCRSHLHGQSTNLFWCIVVQAGELETLERFKRQFDGAAFRKGLQITFNASGNKLTTAIDGKQVCRLVCCLSGVTVSL